MNFVSDPKVQKLLEDWKIQELRPAQEQVLTELLKSRSGLLVLPTGGGKSLVYQLCTKMLQFAAESKTAFTLVVTPLIALMEDQTKIARNMGFRSANTHAGQTTEQKERFLKQIEKGQLDLVFVTPERFRRENFWQALKARVENVEGAMIDSPIDSPIVDLLVIDEAHCVSQWGHDFRPEYSKLGAFRKKLGSPLTLACTATATPAMIQEIQKSLDLQDGFLVKTPIRRPELSLQVQWVEDQGHDLFKNKLTALKASLSPKGPSLVYASLIQTLYRIKEDLPDAMIFHGDLPFREKKKVLNQFLEAEDGVLLATSSFGLGVNKPNIRQVLHFDLPSCIEAYYQEAGRGGRDGLNADAILICSEEDLLTQMEFIKWNTPDRAYVQRLLQLMAENKDQCESVGVDYLREQLHFKTKRDYRVETTLRVLLSLGILTEAKNRLGYSLAPQELPEKTKTDSFASDKSAAEKLSGEPDQQEVFQTYFNPDRQKSLLTQLHQLFLYAKNEELCRMNWIEKHFGEDASEPCGVCDICRQN